MPTHRCPRTFADRIAAFCRKRLSSLLGPDTDRVEAYLLDLIARHECPPLHSNGYSWREINLAIDSKLRGFDLVRLCRYSNSPIVGAGS